MGGINHQPTKNVSQELTVPAAKALSLALIGLMNGNVQIEELIELTGTTQFGAGRQNLVRAAASFRLGISELLTVKSFTNKVIGMIGSPEYEPFEVSTVDINELVSRLIAGGLLNDDHACREMAALAISGGHGAMFFAIVDEIDRAMQAIEALALTTEQAVDGPEGRQGYFWTNVESGSSSWRTDFMRALTATNRLVSMWAASAAICTESHHIGTNTPGLLAQVYAKTA